MARCPTRWISPHGKGSFTCVYRVLLAAFIEGGTEAHGLNWPRLRPPAERVVSSVLGFDMSSEFSGYSIKT